MSRFKFLFSFLCLMITMGTEHNNMHAVRKENAMYYNK